MARYYYLRYAIHGAARYAAKDAAHAAAPLRAMMRLCGDTPLFADMLPH